MDYGSKTIKHVGSTRESTMEAPCDSPLDFRIVHTKGMQLQSKAEWYMLMDEISLHSWAKRWLGSFSNCWMNINLARFAWAVA